MHETGGGTGLWFHTLSGLGYSTAEKVSFTPLTRDLLTSLSQVTLHSLFLS